MCYIILVDNYYLVIRNYIVNTILLYSFMFITDLCGNSLQDIGNQPIAEISVEESKDVKLSCTLKKISDAYGLFWYRQASRNVPVYILQSVAGKDNKSPDFQHRFSSKVDKTNEDFKLSIANVLIGDSAVYYCAKRPTLLPSCGGTVQKLQAVHLLLKREGEPLHQVKLKQHLCLFTSRVLCYIVLTLANSALKLEDRDLIPGWDETLGKFLCSTHIPLPSYQL
uniref:Ig-like domain-containing protein n=1 Tax=Callorhinchus milii TaxID=7868 RepID=A0A4W3JJJ5_CALMI